MREAQRMRHVRGVTTADHNVSSWRRAQRAGFRLEGVLVNERFNLQGRLRDTRVVARRPR
jgi:RimJ/RimL family protein N-acetyltransferase